MAGLTKRRFFRILLTTFRWCRISVWTLILLLLAGFLYLHLADLPDFLKKPLLRDLRQRGIDAEFAGMRLGWSQEILIENVSFGRAGDKTGPNLSVGSAEIRMNYTALFRGQFKVRSFIINQGRFYVPLNEAHSESISLDNVGFVFQFLPGDCVRLENAHGNIGNMAIHLEGVLTNFSAIRDWRPPASPAPDHLTRTNQQWQTILRQVVSIADKIHFTSPPELTGKISGDARDPDSLQATLLVAAPGAVTPWGQMTHFKLDARCSHILNPGDAPFARLTMSADGITTTWGSGNQINLRMELHRTAEDANLLDGKVNLSALRLTGAGPQWGTNWARLGSFQWDGTMTFGVTNFLVPKAEGQLHVQQFSSSWGTLQEAHASFQSTNFVPAEPLGISSGYWTLAQGRKLNWQVEAVEIMTPQVELQSAKCSGHWSAPDFVIENVESKLYSGTLKSTAHLNVATRQLGATLYTDFDPKGFANLLSASARKWLNEFQYLKPPVVQCEASVVLPSWTNSEPDWIQEVLPTFNASGNFSIGPLSGRSVSVRSAESAFTYSNLVWTLTNLHAVRTDGEVRMDYTGNILTHQFQATIDTQLDPKGLITRLDDSQETKDLLDTVQLAHPPKIHAEASGDWESLEKIQASATFEATNFVALGQPIGRLTFSANYSNLVVTVTNLQLIQGDQVLTIPQAQYNLTNDRVILYNAYATFNPRRVFKALEPILPPFLNAIWFDAPNPVVQAYGFFSLTDDRDVDLHFQIAGKKFRWSDYTADSVSGNVDWVGPDVWLTNVVGTLYGGGTMNGWATFDCRVPGVAIRFAAATDNVDLKPLARDISGRDMNLEGRLNVSIDVHGLADSRKSWEGEGQASLRDGLLWDIPMFGQVLSPVLNTISKGVANNRAREASGTFIVTNGVVQADHVEIQASWVRLVYSGTVDEKTIDAKVEAQLLRNTPIIGSAISLVFTPLTKVLKYRVTGPVGDPEIKPEYVPGMILDKTLHPIKTLKNTFTPGSSTPSNNDFNPEK